MTLNNIRHGDWILMPEWTTEKAIVLSSKTLGENTYILSVFTAEHGRHLGVIKKKHPPEIGTLLHTTWKARLPEQLGTFYIEEQTAYAPLFLDDMPRLNTLSCICTLLDKALPERQAYSTLYDYVLKLLQNLSEDDFIKQYVLFEISLLSNLGFGLDTSTCAGGGNADDLAYISPKTGRAVSREKGKPYHDRLLPLPKFIWKDCPASEQDLWNGLKLTEHFLTNCLPNGIIPGIRSRLLKGKNG